MTIATVPKKVPDLFTEEVPGAITEKIGPVPFALCRSEKINPAPFVSIIGRNLQSWVDDMALLAAGVVLWIVVHLTPAVAPGFRRSMIGKLGEKAWKGLFALDILIALALIVAGWRGTVPEAVYLPPVWGSNVAILLMVLSVFLFGIANYPSAVKRYIRHPMLTGMVVWSVAHLLANGDDRSLLLFGGLGVWALIEIPLISRREGAWIKPAAPPMAKEIRGALISVVIFAVLVFLHPYFAGVSPMPR